MKKYRINLQGSGLKYRQPYRNIRFPAGDFCTEYPKVILDVIKDSFATHNLDQT